MTDAFTYDDYAELLQQLRAATDDDVTAILSNNFNVVLGALTALPLIRSQAFEEAAKVAEDEDGEYSWAGEHRNMALLQQHSRELAAAIRALSASPDAAGEG